MRVSLFNPYGNEALPWLKGNFHTHTTNSDGPFSPQETLHRYQALGYDFVMLSDHDYLTTCEGLDPCGLALIPGAEISLDGPHILQVGARSLVPPDPGRQAVLDAIAADGSFAIMCHPNFDRHFNHCPQDLLETLAGYAGIEIFNAVVMVLEGSPWAADRWDRLLGHGRRVWGFANDDCHRPSGLGLGWNMVQSADRSPRAIIEAARQGRFYASNGVTIERIRVEGMTITLEAPDACQISVYSDFGFRRAFTEDSALSFTVPADAAYHYVRFECTGCAERKAWTQPFFLEHTE